MAFPQPFLDALTERNPIDEVVGQYVSLTRRGSNLFGLCPFHSERPRRSPSRRTRGFITASAATRAAA